MPIQGYTRHRQHTFGKQSAFGTAVTPTRAIPWRGVPDINPNWTDQEADTGSIDVFLPPYRTFTDVTVPFTAQTGITYDDLAIMGSMGIVGGVSPSGGGAAKTYTFAPPSLTATAVDYYTDEFGDDVTSDGMRLRDLILENWELSFGDDLGPWQFSGSGRAGLRRAARSKARSSSSRGSRR